MTEGKRRKDRGECDDNISVILTSSYLRTVMPYFDICTCSLNGGRGGNSVVIGRSGEQSLHRRTSELFAEIIAISYQINKSKSCI